VTKEPRHRVTFENAQMRIFDVNIPPGAASIDHRHDRDIVTVSMTGGTEIRIQNTEARSTASAPRRPLGDAMLTEYAGKPGSHTEENIGTSAYQLFAIENLKASGWTTTPPAKGLATTLMTEARSFRVYDVRLAQQASQTSHTHAVPTVAVLVSGKVMSDGPDTHAKENAPAAVGLRQLDQPGQWLLIPQGDTHHLVRLGTADARLLEIEVR
jgi:quercetin dioxygenase-like cupin family protein